jgi:hypothetical protein
VGSASPTSIALNKNRLCKMWKAKTAFHISHSHDGGLGIYPMPKTETDVYTK